MHVQTHLYYLPRHSPLLKHQRRRHPKSTRTTTADSKVTAGSTRSAVASPSPVSPAAAPSPGAMTLVAMFGEMIGERMQMCMRLEEMVRDAVDRDQLTVVSDSSSNY